MIFKNTNVHFQRSSFLKAQHSFSFEDKLKFLSPVPFVKNKTILGISAAFLLSLGAHAQEIQFPQSELITPGYLAETLLENSTKTINEASKDLNFPESQPHQQVLTSPIKKSVDFPSDFIASVTSSSTVGIGGKGVNGLNLDIKTPGYFQLTAEKSGVYEVFGNALVVARQSRQISITSDSMLLEARERPILVAYGDSGVNLFSNLDIALSTENNTGIHSELEGTISINSDNGKVLMDVDGKALSANGSIAISAKKDILISSSGANIGQRPDFTGVIDVSSGGSVSLSAGETILIENQKRNDLAPVYIGSGADSSIVFSGNTVILSNSSPDSEFLAIYASTGTVNIKASESTHIHGSILASSRYDGAAQVSIGELLGEKSNSGFSTFINGSVYAERGGKAQINFGKNGLLNGRVLAESGGKANLNFGEGSVWAVKGNSVVSELSIKEGLVDYSIDKGNFNTVETTSISSTDSVLILKLKGDSEKSNDKLLVSDNANGNLFIQVVSTGAWDGKTDSGVLVETPTGQSISYALATPLLLEDGTPVIDLGAHLFKLVTKDENNKSLTFLTPYITQDEPSTEPGLPEQKPSPVLSPTGEAVLALAGLGGLNAMYLSSIDDLRKRLGEARYIKNTGLWTSVSHQKDRIQGFSSTSFKQNAYSFNLGIDHLIGDWVIGTNFKYATFNQKTKDGNFRAKGDGELFGLNLYASWIGRNGLYGDFVLSWENYRDRIKTHMLNGIPVKGTFRNNGVGISAEAGNKFAFGKEKSIFVEPQIQLSYHWIHGDKFSTSNQMRIKQGNVNNLTGRAGVVFGKEIRSSSEKEIGQVYLKTGMIYDFLGRQKIYVNNERFDDKLLGSRVYYGGGGTLSLGKNLNLFGHLERENGAHFTKELEVQIGLRYSF